MPGVALAKTGQASFYKGMISHISVRFSLPVIAPQERELEGVNPEVGFTKLRNQIESKQNYLFVF